MTRLERRALRGAIAVAVVIVLSIPSVGIADSQQGGVPALRASLEALRASVAAEVATLRGEIAALQLVGGGQATAFVAMGADGTVRYSKGVDASNPLTTGKFPGVSGGYQVLFTRDVSQCAAVANVHFDAGAIAPAFAMVGRSSAAQVSVQIFRSDGTPFDAPFELAVFCGP